MSVRDLALELAETNPRMQQAFAQLLQAVSDDFAGKLEPIAAHCADAPAPTAAELAETLLGPLEGSLVLAKHTEIRPAFQGRFAVFDSPSRWSFSHPVRKFFTL